MSVQGNPEVILELVHFGHVVDYIQCYCERAGPQKY